MKAFTAKRSSALEGFAAMASSAAYHVRSGTLGSAVSWVFAASAETTGMRAEGDRRCAAEAMRRRTRGDGSLAASCRSFGRKESAGLPLSQSRVTVHPRTLSSLSTSADSAMGWVSPPMA